MQNSFQKVLDTLNKDTKIGRNPKYWEVKEKRFEGSFGGALKRNICP